MFARKLLAVVLLVGILFSQSAMPSAAAKACDQAQFISDLTVPDGTSFSPGATFTKTWRLMNIGSCTWTESYSLAFFSGEQFGASASVQLPVEVAPGQMLDVSLNMTAPKVGGHYRGYWKLNNPYPSGGLFGIGSTGSDAFWVDINVLETNAVIYDFIANAPYALWTSGAGSLPYPGTSGDSRGYSYKLDYPRLENDSTDSLPGLLTVPHNKYNGYIQATYPEFLVNKGDHLQTLVNCEFGATGCYVTFRIDYINSKGSVKEFWKWKEAYDGRFYRADLDLSFLAGQKVKFILMTLSTGSASGDRAVWGATRIVRTSTEVPPVSPATLTPLPPLTPTLTPFVTAPVISPAGCDKASFVADITVPDGTFFSPGSAFTKTWRIKNIGSCAWTTSYSLIYYSGEQMMAPTSLNMPKVIGSGQTVDLSLNMTAPASPGKYRGYWILRNSSGQLFGIGSKATTPFWIEINVIGSPTTSTGYDFAANVCSAEWKSGAGVISPCPGLYNDYSGFVVKMDSTKLEDGTINDFPSLVVGPQIKYNGYVQGAYPAFTVQPGDRFRATVGCEYGTSCYVSFKLDYITPTGSITNFWTWREQNEGRPYNVDLDLTPLVGRSVRFILALSANGSAVNDRAVWSAPMIVRTYIAPPTPTPTSTPTPQVNDWLTYTNLEYGFQFKYPKPAQVVDLEANSIRMILPIAPGTNLREKYLQVTAVENFDPCSSMLGRSSILSSSETMVINGITFLKETGGDSAAGQIHQWVAYSTVQANVCVVFDFVMRITNPGNYLTPPPAFNEAAEIAVLADMINTFAWLGATPTPTFTPPPVSYDWPTYANSKYGFQLRYPKEAQLTIQNDNAAHLILPIATGTNLKEKSMDIIVREDLETCRSLVASSSMLTSSETVTINGTPFLKEVGEDGAAGSLYQWVAYSTLKGNACISVELLLHSLNPGAYSTPPPVFDYAAETVVIAEMISTLAFLPPTPTPPDNDWLTFSNYKYGFAFRYPKEGQIAAGSDNNFTRVDLPFNHNTNLTQKYLEVVVVENANPCQSPLATQSMLQTSENITINGIPFLKQTGNEGGMSHLYEWLAYSTLKGNACISMDFMLISVNAIYPPPPVFDKVAESIVFTDIMSTFGWLAPTPTPTPDPTIFVQSIVDVLNAKNFDAAKAMMDQTFAFGYWESEGTSATPEEAIESLRNYHLGTTPLTPNASEDLTALLGGLNPYATMGLDPAKSQALFVTGWGLDGKAEAILYATQRADGSLYWFGVLIAPTGFIHGTPPPVTLIGPYAVTGIVQNDVLNIRAGAGTSFQIVGSFARDATNVMRTTEPSQMVDGSEWVEVIRPDGGRGWVNSNFLTEYVTKDAFCADSRISPLITQLKNAMNQSDGALLGSLVSPKHGLNLNYWPSSDTVNYTSATVQTAFTDTQVINWGSGGGSGIMDSGTFAQIVQPQMVDVLNSVYELNCDALSYGQSYTNVLQYTNTNIHFYSVAKPPTTVLDWKVWLIRIEYVNGSPYLFGAVHYVWEP